MKARQAAVEAKRASEKAAAEAEQAHQTYLAVNSAAIRARDSAAKAAKEGEIAKRCARWAWEEADKAKECAEEASAAARAIGEAMNF